MHPILFQVPHTPIKIFAFGAMLIVALWSALGLATWRAGRERLNPEMVGDMAFWVIVFGLVGARVTFVLGTWGEPGMQTLGDALAVWRGGIVLYGSILGGILGFIVYHKLRPFPVLATLDVVAPSLAVGIAFGRLGCFLNGCCHGDRCALPWAVRFPYRSLPWMDHFERGWIARDAALSLPVHPAQIYSALDGFLLLALVSAYYPLRRRDGEVMALLMVTLPITRFLIEMLRDDDVVAVAGLTIAQAISVGIFACGLGFWAWLRTKPAHARVVDLAPAHAAELQAA